MRISTVMSFGIALWLGGCTLYVITPSPMPPTLAPQPEPTETASPMPPTLTPLPRPTEIPSPTPVPGSALLFDGRDDYVRVEDDPSLDLPSSFTIAAWINLQDYTEWASVVTKGDKPNFNNYALHQSGPGDPTYGTEFGKLRFSACTPVASFLPQSATSMMLARWYFVAITFDGLRLTFYLNGEEDGSQQVAGPLCTNNQPLYIGVDFPLTTEYWSGAIDELRIWNAALPAGQIHDVMNGSQAASDPALVGYWSFDEGSDSTVHDRSGHENHGTFVGDPIWISPGAPIP